MPRTEILPVPGPLASRLLAALLEEPGDETLRDGLADALREAGDPRADLVLAGRRLTADLPASPQEPPLQLPRPPMDSYHHVPYKPPAPFQRGSPGRLAAGAFLGHYLSGWFDRLARHQRDDDPLPPAAVRAWWAHLQKLLVRYELYNARLLDSAGRDAGWSNGPSLIPWYWQAVAFATKDEPIRRAIQRLEWYPGHPLHIFLERAHGWCAALRVGRGTFQETAERVCASEAMFTSGPVWGEWGKIAATLAPGRPAWPWPGPTGGAHASLFYQDRSPYARALVNAWALVIRERAGATNNRAIRLAYEAVESRRKEAYTWTSPSSSSRPAEESSSPAPSGL
jgi:uncharacterized protein (TIGR02996 family)